MEALYLQLHQLMDRELAATHRLRIVLEQEQDAVKRKKIDDMNATLTAKLDLLEELGGLDQERISLLSETAYANTKSGFLQLIASVDHGTDLAQKWGQLEAELKQCHQLHLVNTKLLDIGMRQVRQLLGVILGADHSAAARGSVYTKQGMTAQSLTTHTYAKA